MNAPYQHDERLPRRKPIKRKAPRRLNDPALTDEEYLNWVRTLPCACCVGMKLLLSCAAGDFVPYIEKPFARQTSPTEAAHTGDHPAYRRAPDRTAIPLCAIEHHREGPESHHKLGKRFFPYHNLDRDALVAALNAEFDREHSDAR